LGSAKAGDPRAYEYYLRGVDLYASSNFQDSIKMLETSAQMDSTSALTWAMLGRAYTTDASFHFGGSEAYQKALAAYEKALVLDPAQIACRVYMANLFTDTGRAEPAVPKSPKPILFSATKRSRSACCVAAWKTGSSATPISRVIRCSTRFVPIRNFPNCYTTPATATKSSSTSSRGLVRRTAETGSPQFSAFSGG
jgi:hypothetical protein